MRKPATQKDQLSTVWDVVIGNGNTGLVDKMNDCDLKITDMKGDVSYIKGKIDGLASGGPSRKRIWFHKFLESSVSVAIVGAIVLVAVLLFTKRLDAEDIANILRAWKGE